MAEIALAMNLFELECVDGCKSKWLYKSAVPMDDLGVFCPHCGRKPKARRVKE
jgi:hypothetical protein